MTPCPHKLTLCPDCDAYWHKRVADLEAVNVELQSARERERQAHAKLCGELADLRTAARAYLAGSGQAAADRFKRLVAACARCGGTGAVLQFPPGARIRCPDCDPERI